MFRQIVRRNLFAASVFVLLIVAFSGKAIGSQPLPRMNWNERAYEAVTKWMERLEGKDRKAYCRAKPKKTYWPARTTTVAIPCAWRPIAGVFSALRNTGISAAR